jgi:hypothetical protein
MAGAVAFDFAPLRSGRTDTEQTLGEEVYESPVFRFSCRLTFALSRDLRAHPRTIWHEPFGRGSSAAARC